MPNTVPAAGEAMPTIHLEQLVMDAQNLLSEIKHLNEAIFMAASALADRDQMNAISTVGNIISEKLCEVEEMLDAARGSN